MKRSQMQEIIHGLHADEAFQVLKELLKDNPSLIKSAYDIAMKNAHNIDPDGIMDDVFFELNQLDMDDLNGRAGRTKYGYVDPSEAAGELFEETMTPFIDEMKRNQERSLPAVAKAYCIGIIKGLRKFDKESYSDLKDWFVDEPSEYVYTVLDEWKKGNPDKKDIREVMSFVESDE
jgi:hypothetical protein